MCHPVWRQPFLTYKRHINQYISIHFLYRFDTNLQCNFRAEEGVLLIYFESKLYPPLGFFILEEDGFHFVFFFSPSTSLPPPRQPSAHFKSSCYFSLILHSPLLIVPKPLSSPKVKIPELHKIATACVFFFKSFIEYKVLKPCFCW